MTPPSFKPRVIAVNDRLVAEIERCGANPDDDLARQRLRLGQFDNAEVVGALRPVRNPVGSDQTPVLSAAAAAACGSTT